MAQQVTTFGDSMSMLSRPNNFYDYVLALMLVTALSYGLTLRGGVDWSEDPALYIIHGISLAEGLPYNHLGLPNFLTGREFSYPFGLPVIIALVYSIFGLSFYALKWIVVASFILFSIIFIVYLRRNCLSSDTAALIFGLTFVANPIVWDMKDDILSDAPFLLISFLSLFVYDAIYSEHQTKSRSRPALMALLSLTLVAAYALRSVGLVLPVTIICFELFRFRRIHFATLLVLTPFAGYVLAEYFLAGSLETYVNQSSSLGLGYFLSIDRLVERANFYRWAVANWFSGDTSTTLDAIVLYGMIGVPTLIGYISRLITKPTVLEIFGPIYFLIFLIPNVAAYDRYMMPIFVLILIYAAHGLDILSKRYHFNILYSSSVFVSVILLSYAAKYTTLDYDRFEQGVDHPSAQVLFEWIKDETDKNDVFVASKSATFRLMAERKVGSLGTCRYRRVCPLDNYELVWRYLQFIGAKYIILKKTDWMKAHYLSDEKFVGKFVEENQIYFNIAFENTDFRVLAITRYADLIPRLADQSL